MPPPSPLVSVLLPVRSPDPDFFRAAVGSVLAQSLSDFELLVVEAADGAELTALELLEEDPDPRIRIVSIAVPTSLVAQLNLGLELARADLVARMDADDICEPHRLATQVRFLNDHPEVDVVGSHLTIIDQHGAPRGFRFYPTRHEAIVDAMERFNPLAHPAVMFRRRAVVEAGGYRFPDVAAQDYDLFARMALRGRRFANCDEPLLRYRLHPGAIKAAQVRDTLRSSMKTKRRHFGSSMSLRGRLRLALEGLALLAPPALTLRAFQLLTYAPASIEQRFARRELGQTAILVVTTGVGALLGMIYMIMAGRRLGPSAASDFYAAVFLSFFLIVLSSPVGSVVARFTAMYTARDEHERAHGIVAWAIRGVVAGGGVILLFAWLAAPVLANLLHLGSPALVVLAAATGVLFVWLMVGRAYLRGVQRFGAHGANVVGEGLLRLFVGLAVLTVAATPASALAAYIVSSALAVAALESSLRRARGRRGPPGPVESGAVIAFGAPLLALALLEAGYQNIDVLLVKGLFAATEAGLYGSAATLTRVLGVLVTPFVVLLLPVLVNRHERGLPTGGALLRACAGFLALAAVPLSLFAVWPESLMGALLGDEFKGAAPLLLPHGLSVLAGYLALLVAQGFVAVGRFRFLTVYALGLVVLVAAIGRLHQSTVQVARIMLAVKLAVLIVLLVTWIVSQRGGRR